MEARAIQRSVRQSARKMRLVIDLIRGRPVPEAYAILQFSKKRAARQIRKVLQSAVANAKHRAGRQDVSLDEDRLRVQYAVVNEGRTLKRFTSAAMGRATPVMKRSSHVEIRVASEPEAPQKAAKAAAPGQTAAGSKPKPGAKAGGARSKAKKSAKAKKSTRKAGKRKTPARRRST
jgi:large subunit ribosomal protein L22